MVKVKHASKHQLQNNYKGTWLVWFEHKQLLILVRTGPLSITITTLTSYDIQRVVVLTWHWSDGGPNSMGLRLSVLENQPTNTKIKFI